MFPSRNSVLIYIYIFLYVCILYTSSVIGLIYTYTKSVAQYWWSCTPSQSIGLVFGGARVLCWMPLSVFFGLPFVSWSMIFSLILGCLWPLNFCNISPPRGVLPLDFLSEYRIQRGAIGSLYVTSSSSTWVFCRGVSGFATDCPWAVGVMD